MAAGQDSLLIVFIHGFMGSDSTFGSFPKHLEEALLRSTDNAVTYIVHKVYPKYKTKGQLGHIVTEFAEWLNNLVLAMEATSGNSGTGKVKVVLCGHSMGGLVAADTTIRFLYRRPNAHAPPLPRIIACLAFDTPYLGLDINVARIMSSDVDNHLRTLRIPRLRLSAIPGLGGIVKVKSFILDKANVAAGYVFKGFSRLCPHLYPYIAGYTEYLANISAEDYRNVRLDSIVGYDKEMRVLFRTFYTRLPAKPPLFENPRTFIVLPEPNTRHADHFLAAPNGRVRNEFSAHTGMFAAKTNDGYDQLVLETSKVIEEAISRHEAL